MNNPVISVINSRLFPGRSIQVGLIILIAVILSGCSGGSTPPRELLLSPDDFPDQVVTETIQASEDSNLSAAAVLVELKGSEFALLESLVLFESNEVATKVLAEIKRDQLAQGVDAHPKNGFDDNSGVMAEALNGVHATDEWWCRKCLIDSRPVGPRFRRCRRATDSQDVGRGQLVHTFIDG